MKTKKWYNYLWIAEISYFILGFFNILFAWLGMIFFLTPLAIAVITGNKSYCHKYCGRGQVFALVGKKFSRNKPLPTFMRTSYFRYGFLAFFMTMFLNMIYTTYLVFGGTTDLSQIVTLLWSFKLPWDFAYTANVTPWVAQYAFGFYSVMLTSATLGIITSLLFKPRGFCVYCPMGTMTQSICKFKNGGNDYGANEGECKGSC